MKRLVVLTFILHRGHMRGGADYAELNEYIRTFDHIMAVRSLSTSVVIVYTEIDPDEIRDRLVTMIEPEFDSFSVDRVPDAGGLLPLAQEVVDWLKARPHPGTPD